METRKEMSPQLGLIHAAKEITEDFARFTRLIAEEEVEKGIDMYGLQPRTYIALRASELMVLEGPFKRAVINECEKSRATGEKPDTPIEILRDIVNLNKIHVALESKIH